MAHVTSAAPMGRLIDSKGVEASVPITRNGVGDYSWFLDGSQPPGEYILDITYKDEHFVVDLLITSKGPRELI